MFQAGVPHLCSIICVVPALRPRPASAYLLCSTPQSACLLLISISQGVRSSRATVATCCSARGTSQKGSEQFGFRLAAAR